MTVDEAVHLDNDCQNCVTEPYKQDLEEHIENNDQEALIRIKALILMLMLLLNLFNTQEAGIHAPSSKVPSKWHRRKLRGWLHSHLVPEGFKTAIEKKFGNFVIIRSTGELHYEEMPIYTRIGMHLLFGGYYRGKVDNSNIMHALFLKETVRQGQYFTQPESVKQIPSFVQHYTIEMDDYVISDVNGYKNFNEFFTRAILPSKRPIAETDNHNVLVAAADSRLNVFNSIDAATTFWIKGKEFTLANLLQDNELANELEGGSLAIFRLAPQDYHRFHTPAKGKIKSIKPIVGTYYTVNPCTVNQDLNVFTDNHRSVVALKSHHGFSFAVVSIGALLVGSIVNTHAEEEKELEKGQEMGYFQYGGSTVIAVFPKNSVTWDEDLLSNSEKSIETVVTMGERIGIFN
ncbi:hypothetical protein INT46_006934 [Mucor plumbeus]|uniref:phosphatidylserine decarboxylase n=1 Tax=Mucor plumbeus TaxID=97098 RepID=A0A8H7QM47_9FUNG|nr:hypothetical protein INT46_006934 [Mucor plumbeus]